MKRFLSLQGQNILGLLLASLALCTVIGFVLVTVSGPSDWSMFIGRVLLLSVVAGMLFLSIFCTHPVLTSYALSDAAARCGREEAQRRLRSLTENEICLVPFRKMVWWNKICYGTALVLGAVLIGYGVSDMLGDLPVLRIPRKSGGWVTVPHLMSGTLAILIGVTTLLSSQLLKFQIRNMIDEAIAKATRIVRGEFGGRIH